MVVRRWPGGPREQFLRGSGGALFEDVLNVAEPVGAEVVGAGAGLVDGLAAVVASEAGEAHEAAHAFDAAGVPDGFGPCFGMGAVFAGELEQKVILVDDVLFTGRTIRAGLDALIDFGRPEKVELLVLVDRRYSRHLPIAPDYIGLQVDTITTEKVKVQWKESDGEDGVWLV